MNQIVIEFGSFFTRCGMADYTTLPESVISCVNPDSNHDKSIKLSDLTLSFLEKVSWPIKEGIVVDWETLELLCKDLIENKIGLDKIKNDNLFLLSVPCSWSLSDYQYLSRLFFEKFNVPGIYIAEQPLLAVYGFGLQSGLVVDIGYSTISVTPVIDNQVYRYAQQVIQIGSKDIQDYLKTILLNDTVFKSQYHDEIDLNLLNHIITSPLSFISTPLTLESIPVEYTFNEKKFSISQPSRMYEPLFEPSLVGKKTLSIQEALSLSITSCPEIEKRLLLWENVLLVGGLSDIQGLSKRLEYEISPFIASSETSNEMQPKEIKFPKCPEFLIEYKKSNQNITYLGGTIFSRIVFGESRHYQTRNEYQNHGPFSILGKIM